MANLILFISPAKLKKETALGGSVDDEILQPYIRLAQEMHILPTLGQSLYDDLNAKVAAGTISGADETLMDSYIAPALVQLAFSESLPFIRVRIVNNGVTVMDSEQSTAATYGDMKPLMNRAKDLGLFHIERLIDYLDNNGSLFPTLDQEGPGQLCRTVRNYTQGLNIYPNYRDDKLVERILRDYGIRY
jgi:hypothetical protein